MAFKAHCSSAHWSHLIMLRGKTLELCFATNWDMMSCVNIGERRSPPPSLWSPSFHSLIHWICFSVGVNAAQKMETINQTACSLRWNLLWRSLLTQPGSKQTLRSGSAVWETEDAARDSNICSGGLPDGMHQWQLDDLPWMLLKTQHAETEGGGNTEQKPINRFSILLGGNCF